MELKINSWVIVYVECPLIRFRLFTLVFQERESSMTESFCWIVAILPWLRPRLAICPISQGSPALAP